MLCIRQALRFGTRLVRAQYSVHYCASILNYKFSLKNNCLVHGDASDRKELGKLEGKMKLMFTCKKCSTRNSKLISKLAYNKGVIIVRCDGCKNNHLIADNLGWFTDINSRINIEKIMALKGETVKKIINDIDGYYEMVAKEEFNTLPKDCDTEATIENSNYDNSSDKVEKTGTSKES